MRIEFLGISGVGKTYVAMQYASHLQKKGDCYVWPWQNLYGRKGYIRRNLGKGLVVLGRIIKSPKWCSQFVRVLNSNQIKGIIGKIILVYNGIYLKYVLEKYEGDGISIFDEGVVQFIWAVHLRNRQSPTKAEIGEFLKLFGKPDRLFVVDATVETIMHRLISRGVVDRIRGKGDLGENIRQMDVIKNEMVSILSEEYGVKIVRILNDEGKDISFGLGD